MSESNQDPSQLIVFKGKNIRRAFHDNEWWFSVVDVIGALTDSQNPNDYWYRTKKQLQDEEKAELSIIYRSLKLTAEDGKMRNTDCANTEGLFRIIQSIPSPKAEPFKRWLAKVGYERVKEIENPELASQRARAIYRAKGYPDDWIEKRMRSVAIREELTEEWQNRSVKESKEFSILTAEISKATFGMTPSEYKNHKGLKSQNLRDHMTDLELIFSMLGEASTTEIAKNTDAQGFDENKVAAQQGGQIAGNARLDLEQKSSRSVISKSNYLPKGKTKGIISKNEE